MRTPPSTINVANRYDPKMMRVLRGDKNAGKIIEARIAPETRIISSPIHLLTYQQNEQLSSTVHSMCSNLSTEWAFLSPLAPICSRLIDWIRHCFTWSLTNTRFLIIINLIVCIDFEALVSLFLFPRNTYWTGFAFTH